MIKRKPCPRCGRYVRRKVVYYNSKGKPGFYYECGKCHYHGIGRPDTFLGRLLAEIEWRLRERKVWKSGK